MALATPEPTCEEFVMFGAPVVMPPAEFRYVADTVVARMSDLLDAPVVVVDGARRVAASRRSELLPGDHLGDWHDHMSVAVCVPLRCAGQMGEVVVGQASDGATLSARIVEGLVHMVLDQAAALSEVKQTLHRKDHLIRTLLHNASLDEEAIRHQAMFLGLDLTPPRAVILVNATNYILGMDGSDCESGGLRPNLVSESQVHRRTQRVIQSIVSFFSLPNDTICASLDNGEIAILKACDTKNLAAWSDDPRAANQSSWANIAALSCAANGLLTRLRADTGAQITIGIGRYHPGLSGLARSYQDARAALELGCRFHKPNQVHCLSALGPEVFVALSDQRTKSELACYLLSPLLGEAELLTTLDIFFEESCHLVATARRLTIHRNTLSYRLDKIAALTGLDPRNFDSGVQLRLALLCCREWLVDQGALAQGAVLPKGTIRSAA